MLLQSLSVWPTVRGGEDMGKVLLVPVAVAAVVTVTDVHIDGDEDVL